MDKIGSGFEALPISTDHPTKLADTGVESIATLRQTLTKAARTVNHVNFAGEGREVTFTIDAETKRPIVKVIDSESREVVTQWPSEYLLRIAEELKSTKRNSG